MRRVPALPYALTCQGRPLTVKAAVSRVHEGCWRRVLGSAAGICGHGSKFFAGAAVGTTGTPHPRGPLTTNCAGASERAHTLEPAVLVERLRVRRRRPEMAVPAGLRARPGRLRPANRRVECRFSARCARAAPGVSAGQARLRAVVERSPEARRAPGNTPSRRASRGRRGPGSTPCAALTRASWCCSCVTARELLSPVCVLGFCVCGARLPRGACVGAALAGQRREASEHQGEACMLLFTASVQQAPERQARPLCVSPTLGAPQRLAHSSRSTTTLTQASPFVPELLPRWSCFRMTVNITLAVKVHGPCLLAAHTAHTSSRRRRRTHTSGQQCATIITARP